jgi:hypothetical protein
VKTEVVYRPVRFFAIAYLITWVCELIAVYFSYQKGMASLTFLFVVAGLFGPLAAAWIAGNGPGSQAWREY